MTRWRRLSWAGFLLSPMVSYDTKNSAVAEGVDLNFVQPLFNAGLSYRSWNKTIPDWKGNDRRQETAVYLGVGLVNFVQLQAGYSQAGTSLRLRSDLVIGGGDFYMFDDSGRRWGRIFREGVVVTPYIEASPWSKNKRFLVGLGVGVYF